MTYRSGAAMASRLTIFLWLASAAAPAAAEVLDVWLGTATSPGGARGIYHAGLDDETGKLSRPRLVAQIEQPGFLAIHPRRPILYSASAAGVAAFGIERSDAGVQLAPMGSQSADAGSATHLSIDATGRVLVAAFYGSGVVASFPLDATGRIGQAASRVQHTGGSGVVPSRQKGPHPHWAGLSPDNRYVMVPDLGLDQIVIYRLNARNATLTEQSRAATPPGGGPRHLAFHPSGRWAYVVNELAMTLTALEHDAPSGTLTPIQTIATLTDEQRARESFNSGSEVRVHPSGRFVYSANRGHDSITAFAIDKATGRLTPVEQEPIRGAWPRNFNLDPSGRWLLAAGRDSNTLAVFEVSPTTGELRYTRKITSTPAPICVVVGRAD